LGKLSTFWRENWGRVATLFFIFFVHFEIKIGKNFTGIIDFWRKIPPISPNFSNFWKKILVS